MAEEKVEEKNFRLNSKSIFVTWPQCGVEMTKEKILSCLKELGLLKGCRIAKELHQDGGIHFHAAANYNVKLTRTNPRCLDIDGHHPNLQKVRSWKHALNYIAKDGDFTDWGVVDGGEMLDMTTCVNYRKRKSDYIEYTRDMTYKKKEEVKWPITLPNGQEYNPIGMGKKRHLWLIGAPDIGKTTWLTKTFKGMKTYRRGGDKYPFDTYKGQSVIIYDDKFPKFSELSEISVVYEEDDIPVCGDTRYEVKCWPVNVEMVMIVISNHSPDYGPHQEAFDRRFNVINL